MSKYKIGDSVWWAGITGQEEDVLCPECFGKKFLTVILGDDSKVTIPCVSCIRGYEEPSGKVYYYKRVCNVLNVQINRVEETREEIEYGIYQSYCVPESEVFDTKEEAEKRAMEISERMNKEEIEKIHRKEKNNRTWAWNVHYHRDNIKRCEKDLIYHKSKLDYAKIKVKEENSNDQTH